MDSSSRLLFEGKNTILSMVCISSNWTRQRINMELKVVFSGEISIRNSENVNPHGLEIFSSKCFFEINALLIQDLIIIWCRVQYYKYFPSCSLFTNFFGEIAGKYEKQRKYIWHYTKETYNVEDTILYFTCQTGEKIFFEPRNINRNV